MRVCRRASMPREALEGGLNRVSIRPLTHSNKDGDVYRRSEQVEQQIQELANLSAGDLVARARNREKDSPGHAQEESLVYWIREYHRRGDSQRASELAEILLERCVKWIQSKLWKLGPGPAPQAEQDVVSQLFSDIFDLDTDYGDFLQVRFWRTLNGIIINTFKRYAQSINRTMPFGTPGEDGEPHDDDIAQTADTDELSLDSTSVEDRELIRSALATIDEPYRTAFILRYYEGWPIESNDASVLTISSYFKKDPRTIRNWLKRVEQNLSEWRNEERL